MKKKRSFIYFSTDLQRPLPDLAPGPVPPLQGGRLLRAAVPVVVRSGGRPRGGGRVPGGEEEEVGRGGRLRPGELRVGGQVGLGGAKIVVVAVGVEEK